MKQSGVIPIENEKRIDWNAIRAEYIGGGISQRKLAKKYGVSETTLMKKANKEGWQSYRKEADSRATAEAQQKTACLAADNATLAADIKRRLLLRLKRTEEKFPMDATEVRAKVGNSYAVYRLKDLTAAYKDLTEDMLLTASQDNALLQSLLDLERRAGA